MDMRSDETPARDIPLPVQREVRQRCGFGCVICGLPLYEYEHLLGWANVKRHVAEEITLLCDRHHREKTNGLLPLEAVLKADKAPFNLRSGESSPYDLYFSGDTCEVTMGTNSFVATNYGYGTQVVPLVIDGIPIVGFILGDDHLLLNVNIFDECNELALRIQNNVVTYRTSNWDVSLTGRDLIVREGKGKILLDIRFDVPNKVHIRRAMLRYSGIEVRITQDHLKITNNGSTFTRTRSEQIQFGLVCGTDAPEGGSAIQVSRIPRYGQSYGLTN